MKKIMVTLMSMAMALMLLPTTAFAEEADGRNLWRVQGFVTYGQTEARSMLGLINQFRTNQQEEKAGYWNEDNSEIIYLDGLGTLQYDYQLEQEAMCRAAELSIEFGHTSPSGDICWASAPHSSGENIACGFTNAEDVFKAWREDTEIYEGQGHRRNMLGENFTSVGIGHAVVDGVHYWVQEFGTEVYNGTMTEAIDGAAVVSLVVDLNRHPEIANGPALPEQDQQQDQQESTEPEEPSNSGEPTKQERPTEPSEQEMSEKPSDASDQIAEPVKGTKDNFKMDQHGNVILTTTAKDKNGASFSAEELEEVVRFMEKNINVRKLVLQSEQTKVTLDKQAICELLNQVEHGDRIIFVVEEIDMAKSDMIQEQKQTVQKYADGKVMRVAIQSVGEGNVAGHELHIDQGQIHVTIYCEILQNQHAHVERVAKDGILLEMKSNYDSAKKELTWNADSIDHAYYLIRTASEESVAAEGNRKMQMTVVITSVCIACASLGVVYIVRRRRSH